MTGSLKRSLGNIGRVANGGGGSGDPVMREVVQAVRRPMPYGLLGSSAADDAAETVSRRPMVSESVREAMLLIVRESMVSAGMHGNAVPEEIHLLRLVATSVKIRWRIRSRRDDTCLEDGPWSIWSERR